MEKMNDCVFADVMFSDGGASSVFRADGIAVRVNDVVIVPTPQGERPAIVCGVSRYRDGAPFILGNDRTVLRRAGRRERAAFRGMDYRVPIDISLKSVRTAFGYQTFVTDKNERRRVRNEYKNDSSVRLTEGFSPEYAGTPVALDPCGRLCLLVG